MNAYPLTLFLYNILYLILSPLIGLYLLRRKDSRKRLKEYLGLTNLRTSEKFTILVHGVSVGEVLSAIPLVKILKKELSARIVLSTTIDDAIRISLEHDDIFDERVFLPLDFSVSMRRFLSHSPSLVIISETDFWPNMLAICKEKRIPLYLSNGRISEKLAKGFEMMKPFSSKLLNAFEMFFVQRDIDSTRLVQAGVPSSKIVVAGNSKYESALQIESPSSTSEKILDYLETYKGKYIVGGSTHPGEEELILSFLKNTSVKSVKGIIAPRIISRSDAIYNLTEKEGLKPLLFSKLLTMLHLQDEQNKTDSFDSELFDVLIIDALGELKHIYSLDGIAFIGGTFSTVGGHNFLEAVVHQKAVIAGPDFHNFSEDLQRFLDGEAIIQVKTKGEFLQKATELLTTKQGKEIGERAFKVLVKSQGAVKATASSIIRDLKSLGLTQLPKGQNKVPNDSFPETTKGSP